MSNLGDSNTPVEGESFGLPAGAELGEDNGDLVIQDSGGTIILRRDETSAEWQFENTDLTGINSIDASSANLESGTIATESDELDGIARVSQLQEAGSFAIYTDQNEPSVPASEAIWFDTTGTKSSVGEWEYTGSGSFESDVAIASGIAVLYNDAGTIYAVNISDGTEAWTVSTATDFNEGGVAIADGTVVVGLNDGTARAYDLTDGTELWSLSTGDTIKSGIAISDGTVVFGNNGNTVYGVDITDGTQLWSSVAAESVVQSGAAIENGIAVLGNNGNVVHGYDITDGTELWTYSTSGACLSGVAIENGTAVLGADGNNVHGIDITDGTGLWTLTTGDKVQSGVDIEAGTAVIGSNDRTVYGLDITDGSEQWTFSGTANSVTSVTIDTGTAYVGTSDDDAANLFSLAVSDGSENWSYEVPGILLGGKNNGVGFSDGTVVVGDSSGIISGIAESGPVEIYTLDGYNAIYTTNADTDVWVGENA